jgi:UrcA family protein
MKRTLMAVSAIALFATAAIAGDTVPQKVVPFGDLNLSTQEGVSTLQQRLLAAAAEVCAVDKAANRHAVEACEQKAVRNAVADVANKLAFRLSAMP